MPFRASFACLWCGTSHTCRTPDDLEGWAQLCPECVGKAGDNGFLRFRLHQALRERAAGVRDGGPTDAARTAARPVATLPTVAATAPMAPTASTAPGVPPTRTELPTDDLAAYYEARAPEYDDWYLRRGRYARGAIHDAAWHAEVDAAGRWLDAVPFHGQLLELAAGTGWWSPLLASKGELELVDASPTALDRARERLVAHGLRAHLHVRDAWSPPDRQVDGVFAGFWVSHVERSRLAEFLALVRAWLGPGGRFAAIDSLPDPASGASDHPAPAGDRSVRRLDDGREFTIVKVYYTPDELRRALEAAGFRDVEVTTTGRFFVLFTGRT